MTLRRTPFPDRFAVLSSDTYRFGDKVPDGCRFKVVGRTRLPNGVEVLAINVGLLAFDFSGEPELGGIIKVHFDGSGLVPEEVMESTKHILRVQGARMRLATFVTACVYGTHAYLRASSIDDALFPGLHETFDWVSRGPGSFGVPAHATNALVSRIIGRTGRRLFICAADVIAGFNLASRLISARGSYHVADPISLIVMTYQAMILHNRQHAGASVALQAVVAESALEELLYACGLVNGVPARFSHQVPVKPVSPSKARSMKLKARIECLSDAGVLSPYLAQRLHSLRSARNVLMHEGYDATPQQSGEGLTAIRDLLHQCTDERRFELNMTWSYKI
ncbi:DUF4145 domain-containing protein [Jiella marina]|uniref:DUF4145 domain-containing protein n=1 Tax=Jiella sp. LLJ827 TaxID=2917712 RepID=UPI002100FD8E|nr:DUF4145 domain-containing protein [Jiella sp. LLJ827]MCQ0986874.1 DUF4145 domain-containing protein [Jiella sp. LLJ827]